MDSDHTAHGWFRENLGFGTLLVIATAAITYAVLQVLVIDEIQTERDDAHERVARLEGERSSLAIESGKLQAQIDILNREAGEGSSSYGALRAAITKIEQSQNDLWEILKTLTTKVGDAPRLEFIRTEVDSTIDRCSEDIVTVEGRDGAVTLRKGETKEIPLPQSGEVFWSCGAMRERTRTASGADIAVLSRDPEGRAMTWLFYKLETR